MFKNTFIKLLLQEEDTDETSVIHKNQYCDEIKTDQL